MVGCCWLPCAVIDRLRGGYQTFPSVHIMAADWPPRPTGRRRNARRFAPVRRETRRAPQSSADRPESGGGGAGRSRGGGAAPAPQSAPERAAPAPPPERNKPRPGLPTTEPKRRRGERNPRRRLPRAGGGRMPARGEPTRPTRSGAGAARARRGGAKPPPEWRNRGGAKPRPRRYHASEERDPNARGSGLSGHALPPKGASLCRSAAIRPPVWAVGQSAFPPRNVRRGCAGTAPVGGWQPSDGALCIPSDLSDGIPSLSVHGGQPLYLILGHYSVSSMSLWTECL